MGSGKTSVGKRLACILDYDFFDSDFEIITRTGVSIEHIFDLEGEAGFRTRETKVLKDLVKIPNLVIATGGGIVTKSENLALLKNTFVIYLESDIDTLVDRCSKSNARPIINQAKDKRKVIIDILQQREPIYKDVADIVINTNRKKLYILINEIKSNLLRLNIL